MKIRALTLFLLVLLLSACSSQNAPVVDPYTGMVLADQASEKAADASEYYAAVIQSTQSHLTTKGKELEIDKARIESEVRGTAAALEHQATAVSIEQTQQAPALFLQATQVAIFEKSTQAVLDSTPAAATSVALVAAAKIHEAEVTKAEAMAYVIPASVTILSLLIGGALAWSIISLTEWRVERERLAAGHHDSVFGVLVMDYETGVWKLAAPSDKYKALPRPAPSQEVRWTPNKSTAIGPVRAHDDNDLVRQFLAAAAVKVGTQSTRLPSWRDLPGWTSEKWQSAVNTLKSAGLVETRDRVGTEIIGDDIGGILYQLDTEQLELTPLPRQDPPRER